MSVTITTEAYKFAELPLEAQEKVIDSYRRNLASDYDYMWDDDNVDSFKAFEAIFPVKVLEWSYGGGRGDNISFIMTCDDEVAELQGLRLSKYLWNNYRHKLYNGKYHSLPGNRVIKHKRVKSTKFDTGNVHNAYYSAINFEHSCVLTGYCIDDDLLDCVYALIDCKDHKSLSSKWQSTTFEDLMRDCLEAWISACSANYEYQFSDEAIKEGLESEDDYSYDEDGGLI